MTIEEQEASAAAAAAAEKREKNKAKKRKQKLKKKAAAAAAGGGGDEPQIYGAATGVTNARPADANDKEQQLKELLPQLSSDELQLLLHDSGYNVQFAVNQYGQGDLDDWSTAGSRKKAAEPTDASAGESGGAGPAAAAAAAAAAPAPAAPPARKAEPKGPVATLFLSVKNLPFKLDKGAFASSAFPTAAAVVYPERGEAVVTFPTTEAAQAAFTESKGQPFDGRNMRIAFVASAPAAPAPAAEKPKRQPAAAKSPPKPSGPAVRARETEQLKAAGFKVSSSGMRTFDMAEAQALAKSNAGRSAAAAAAPSPFAAAAPAPAPAASAAGVATRAGFALLDQMQASAEQAWRLATLTAKANFESLRTQLATREKEVQAAFVQKQTEEAGLLQERRNLLSAVKSKAEFDQFMSAMKKDKPSWGSPRYAEDRGATSAIMATGAVLERAAPAVSAREKRGGGGAAKPAGTVQIRPIGSKAKEKKAGSGGDGGGGGNGSGKKDAGTKGGGGKGGKKPSAGGKRVEAEKGDAAADGTGGAKPQREKKQRRARGTGKKQDA